MDKMGIQMCNFMHDEFLIDTSPKDIEKKAEIIAKLMVAGMQKYVPNVVIEVSGGWSDKWTKEPQHEIDLTHITSKWTN